MTRLIGLTGGIASGKSAVADVLRQQGIEVINADQLAREVVQPGSAGLEQIVQRFGSQMLTPEGALDRKKVAEHVFGNRQALLDLNAIVHPRVAEALASRVQQLAQRNVHWACYEVPLLFENQLEDRLRPVILVATSQAAQLARLQARDNLSEEQARSRLQAQMPLEEKLAKADLVLWNDGDFEALRTQALELVGQLRARLGNNA